MIIKRPRVSPVIKLTTVALLIQRTILGSIIAAGQKIEVLAMNADAIGGLATMIKECPGLILVVTAGKTDGSTPMNGFTIMIAAGQTMAKNSTNYAIWGTAGLDQ